MEKQLSDNGRNERYSSSREGSDACPSHVVWSRLDGNVLKKVNRSMREHISEITLMEPDDSCSEGEVALADNYANLTDLCGARSLGGTSNMQTMVDNIFPAKLDRANAHMSHSIQSETSSLAAEPERVRNMPIDDPKLKHDNEQRNAKEKTSTVRPCRGQRIRHRKFFQKMKTAIDDDPEGFDIASVPLPPSLAPGSGYKSGVLARLEAYKYHVMRQRQIEGIFLPLPPSSWAQSSPPRLPLLNVQDR